LANISAAMLSPCVLALRQQLVAGGERVGSSVVSATMRSSAASSWLTTKPPPTE
jgi:hypothetical protein